MWHDRGGESLLGILWQPPGPTDAVLNLLCFLPIGFLMVSAYPSSRPVWLATIACACISLVVEVVQIGVPDRFPSPLDFVLNTAGAAIGACYARRCE